ncbi:hypothetical protein ACJIZ3_021582 [Penstemon smallii]|uniref:Uncharacterized protein n=1 Tax=Penstemon smallii TaxID=265156 RepID=A0ABD3SMT8_9LAMI
MEDRFNFIFIGSATNVRSITVHPGGQPMNRPIKENPSPKTHKSIRGILTFGFGSVIALEMGCNEFGRFDEGFPFFTHGCESDEGFHRKSW